MSGSHVDTVREAVAAMQAGDVERVASLSTPDLEFSPLRAGITGAFRGYEGLAAFWKDTQETFDKFEIGYDTFEELPDGRVLATGTFVTRGRGSTVETEVHSAAVFSLRMGKICAMYDYGDETLAREAVGG
jgi:ketosteroid isomerase-like protein